MRVGRTCGIVRGCAFVPVEYALLFCFFHTFHTNFNIRLHTLIALLYCCLVRGRMALSVGGYNVSYNCGCVFVPVGDGPVILFLIQTAAAICFSPLYRPALAYFRSTTSFQSRKQIWSDFRRGFCIFGVHSVRDFV